MTRLMTDERRFSSGATAIDSLAAPTDSGELLIEPAADRLIAATRANRTLRRSYGFLLLNRPVETWLGPRTEGDAPLVIMSGHQPEFFHPGVWIKHVFATRLAERLDGRMQFLIVDSDVPVVVRLDWPVLRDGLAAVDGARAAAVMEWRSYEYIRDRRGIDYAALFDTARQRYAGYESSPLAAFADAMMAPQSSSTYVNRWQAALTICDASLGIPGADFTRISECFGFQKAGHDEAAAALVAHIIVNAHEFRDAYNGALANYRARRNIAGTQHPIPDLAESERRIETPFWLTNPEHGRERLYATPCRKADCVTIFAGDEPLADIQTSDLVEAPAQALAAGLGDWGIRPRALAQTLYARIFACDVFLHGIGGAKYDQVTDALIRRFFDVEPPAYGCVSATLRLPLPTFDATPAALAEARHDRRDLFYNPQRFARPAELAELAPLFAERTAAIAESDHLRAADRRNRMARKKAYDRIRAADRQLAAALSDRSDELRRRIAQLSRQLEHNRIASNREWFFALYTTRQLKALRDDAWQTVDAANQT